jgi:hypothetical protein
VQSDHQDAEQYAVHAISPSPDIDHDAHHVTYIDGGWAFAVARRKHRYIFLALANVLELLAAENRINDFIFCRNIFHPALTLCQHDNPQRNSHKLKNNSARQPPIAAHMILTARISLGLDFRKP